MSDVAIIGIGIHPFGRTEGMTGLQQGVHAAREALSDAEMEWSNIQFAFGGSSAAGNADANRGGYGAFLAAAAAAAASAGPTAAS